MTDMLKSVFGSSTAIIVAMLPPLITPAAAQTSSSTTAQDVRSSGDPALAQQQASDEGLEDIIVTATKQGEVNLQNVPSSIQVLTTQALQQQQIQGFDDYARRIPSLSSINQGPGQTQVVLRGVTTGRINHSQPQNKSTTGVYIDEIPVASGAFNPDLALFDVARIEVLRGPQGTLYGAGAMSGAIRILTNQPKLDRYEALGEGTVSFTRRGGTNYAARGVVNVPIGKIAALRASGYYQRNGGYIDNVYSGEKDYNKDRTYGGRAALLIDPGEGYSATLNILHQNLKANGRPGEYVDATRYTDLSLPGVFGTALTAPGENVNITGPYQVAKFVDDPFRDKFTIANGVLNNDFGFATLTSSTSYFWRDADNALDDTYRNRKNQGTAVQVDRVGRVLVPFYNATRTRQFSNETRLTSRLGGTIEWIGGVFFLRQIDRFVQSAPEEGLDAILLSYGLPPSTGFGADPNNVFQGRQRINQRQFAGFGELTVNATDKLSALVGLRYYHFDQGFKLRYSGIANDGVTSINTSITDQGVNPKFQVNYEASDKTLVYVQAAKGFRLGGVNEPLPTRGVLGTACPANTPRSFGSDKLWNYEVGFKGQTENRRATLNMAAYQIDWSDIQTSQFLACNFTTVVNAGKARIRGFEGELRIAPLTALVLAASGSYTDAKLVRVTQAYTARAGERLPNVPRVLLNGSVDYTIPMSNNAEIYLRGNVQYQSNSYSDFRSLNSAFKVPSNTSVDAFIGYRKDPFELSLFVKNLTDERIVTAVNIDRNTPVTYSVAAPRTIGLTGRLRY